MPGRDCARLLLQILRMPQRRPPKAELADIAEHIVAGGHGAVRSWAAQAAAGLVSSLPLSCGPWERVEAEGNGPLQRRAAETGLPLFETAELVQLVEQRLCLFKIGRIETFCEPAVDRGEEIAGFGMATLVSPQSREAHGGAQFPELGLLL